MKTLYFSLWCLLLILVSCKKKKEVESEDTQVPVVSKEVQLRLQPVFGSSLLYLDSVYTLADGTDIKISDIRIYFSDITANGLLLKDVALYDYRDKGTLVFKTNRPEGNLTGDLVFGVGIPESKNHTDPSTYPTTHPLNILVANDMHWSWNPGYIFFKLEGKADTLADGVPNFDLNISYHIGMDGNFSARTLPAFSWSPLSSNLEEGKMKLDIRRFFDEATYPLDIRTQNLTHSMPGEEILAKRVRINFVESIFGL